VPAPLPQAGWTQRQIQPQRQQCIAEEGHVIEQADAEQAQNIAGTGVGLWPVGEQQQTATQEENRQPQTAGEQQVTGRGVAQG